MAGTDKSGCLVAIFKLFGGSASETASATTIPYRRKDFLLSKAERSFFDVLQQAMGQEYLLFAKIRVADLLWMPKGTDSRRSHFNKIQAKHIDFVLCDHDVVRPILAIELDDSSHGSATRQSRDAFVDEALRAARLPLLRVPCKPSYNLNDLKTQIHAAIQGTR
jgi:hypothetical protein